MQERERKKVQEKSVSQITREREKERAKQRERKVGERENKSTAGAKWKDK